MSRGKQVFCPSCAKWQPRSAASDTSGMCAACYAADKLAEDQPVSGADLQALREVLGLSRAEAGTLMSSAGAGGDSYLALTAQDVERMESSLVHKSALDRLQQLAERNGQTMTTDNEMTTDVQAATKAAREAQEQFERDEAEAQSLVAELNAAIDRLYALGQPVQDALQRRYRSYVSAVTSERQRARLANDTSHEDSLHIKPFRRNVPPPAGVVVTVELNCEMGVSVVPGEVQPTIGPDVLEYLDAPGNTTNGVPVSARRRREQRAQAGV